MNNKITDAMIDGIAISTAADNDLRYFSAVLHEINKVVSQTYGPEAGYVAQHYSDSGFNTFNYTKDGLTTLANLNFNNPADNIVLSMVNQLAAKIKSTSGDGSTTAAKLLHYMVKFAMNDLQDEAKANLMKKIRIYTPKAMESLIKVFYDKLQEKVNTNPTYEDLRNAALISLNGDETLIEPIDELFKHMQANNAAIDDSLQIDAFRSVNNETTVDYSPGYVLGAKNFLVNPSLQEIEHCKLIIIPNAWTLDMIKFIIQPIVDIIQRNAKGLKVVFLVNSTDQETQAYLKQILREAQAQDTELLFDVIEMSSGYGISDTRVDDLSVYLNTAPISLYGMIEKRNKIIPDSNIDNEDTTNMMKWTAAIKTGPNGKEIFDPGHGLRQFSEKLTASLTTGYFCHIKNSPSIGLTVSISKFSNDQRTEEQRKVYDAHIQDLKDMAKSQNKESAEDAMRRLYYLKENFYVINVARRIGDNERLYTTYKDAVRALTSIAKFGYHMGGSVGLLQIIDSVKEQLSEDLSKDKNNMLNVTKVYLNQLLRESVVSLIRDLKVDFNTMSEKDIISKHVNLKDMTIDGTPVIIPVETDKVMVPNTLYLFSNIFSSLMIEMINPVDTVRIKSISLSLENELKKLTEKPVAVKECAKTTDAEEVPGEEDAYSPIMPTANLNVENEDDNNETTLSEDDTEDDEYGSFWDNDEYEDESEYTDEDGNFSVEYEDEDFETEEVEEEKPYYSNEPLEEDEEDPYGYEEVDAPVEDEGPSIWDIADNYPDEDEEDEEPFLTPEEEEELLKMENEPKYPLKDLREAIEEPEEPEVTPVSDTATAVITTYKGESLPANEVRIDENTVRVTNAQGWTYDVHKPIKHSTIEENTADEELSEIELMRKRHQEKLELKRAKDYYDAFLAVPGEANGWESQIITDVDLEKDKVSDKIGYGSNVSIIDY